MIITILPEEITTMYFYLIDCNYECIGVDNNGDWYNSMPSITHLEIVL